MRYLDISPHTSGYGCDTSVYPNFFITLYEIWYYLLSRYIMQYHSGSPKSTWQNNSNEYRPPCCGLSFALALCLPSSCLVSRLAFFVAPLLPTRWTHHRTDITTRKHQPCPLMIRPVTWAHDCFSCVFLFYFFPCVFSLLLLYSAWYRYRDIPNFSRWWYRYVPKIWKYCVI